jgi:uncharacterized protein YbcI
MTGRLTGLIEDLTGRKVLTYQWQILFDTDRVVELFVFDDTAAHGACAATAEGQISDGQIGEATEQGSLEQADESGQ